MSSYPSTVVVSFPWRKRTQFSLLLPLLLSCWPDPCGFWWLQQLISNTMFSSSTPATRQGAWLLLFRTGYPPRCLITVQSSICIIIFSSFPGHHYICGSFWLPPCLFFSSSIIISEYISLLVWISLITIVVHYQFSVCIMSWDCPYSHIVMSSWWGFLSTSPSKFSANSSLVVGSCCYYCRSSLQQDGLK